MRLINCRTKQIKEFVADIPPYAILSHTWEDEELTFWEMVTDKNALYDGRRCKVTRKLGWKKIEWACDQTVSQLVGVDYLWVDTVCIDKTSSAELSEAINSMFGWYRRATVCFVYLSDVPKVRFAKSRWFTRGWTLQELIAPRSMEFYDRSGRFLVARKNNLAKLEEITGIGATALRNGDTSSYSVACIMSWAAKRETTRVEDQAYCLLGLFGISMPLIYGEGDTAFMRLQTMVYEHRNDQSIFAWRTPPALRYEAMGVFAPAPSFFEDMQHIYPLTQPALGCRAPEVTPRGVQFHSYVALGPADGAHHAVLLDCHDVSKTDLSKPPTLIALRVRPDDHIRITQYTRQDGSHSDPYQHGTCECGIKSGFESGLSYCRPVDGIMTVHVHKTIPELTSIYVPVRVSRAEEEDPDDIEKCVDIRNRPKWPRGSSRSADSYYSYYTDEAPKEEQSHIDSTPPLFVNKLIYRKWHKTKETYVSYLVIYIINQFTSPLLAIQTFPSYEEMRAFDERALSRSQMSASSIEYKEMGVQLNVCITPTKDSLIPILDLFASPYSGPSSYIRAEDSSFDVFL